MQNPFQHVLKKTLKLRPETQECFVDKVIVITGGEGFIGSHLKQKLYGLGAQRVVTIDLKFGADYRTCVSNPSLRQIFKHEKPHYCFHLAAERLPNKAEEYPHKTIQTNIYGTKQVIRACKEQGTKLIFASTGKASRLATKDVYAGTKKIAEWLVNQSGLNEKAIVRFTHVAENSPVTAEIKAKIRACTERGEVVTLHAPNRYLTAQNVGEAVALLLNAAAVSNRVSAISKLEWPVSVDEVLKYQWEKQVGCRPLPPIQYMGVPSGYEGCIFQGQVNPKYPLVNPLEKITYEDDSVYFDLLPINLSLLEQEITPENLNQVVYDCAYSSLIKINPICLIEILEIGINAFNYKPDFVSRLIIKALKNNVYK